MNELPKELSPQLLGLVLEQEVLTFSQGDVFIFKDLKYIIKDGSSIKPNYVNYDTLTRLMKEWSNTRNPKGFQIYSGLQSTQLGTALAEVYSGGIRKLSFEATSEFEVVLKCTHYVMLEKGLL